MKNPKIRIKENRLDEASWSPSQQTAAIQKMQDFNNGVRNENLRACGDEKLEKYYEISLNYDLHNNIPKIEQEIKSRGQSFWQDVQDRCKYEIQRYLKRKGVTNTNTNTTNNIQPSSVLNFFSKELATTIIKNQDGTHILLDIYQSIKITDKANLIKALLASLIFALVGGLDKLVDILKKFISVEYNGDIKGICQNIIDNNYDEIVNVYNVAYASVHSQKESLEEAIEKHETLNPKLWNEDNTLKPEVKDKIKEIVAEFVDGLLEDNITINVKDIVLIGSNASYNYTKDSDVDLHIRVDTSTVDNKNEIYDKLYSAYRTIFNKKFDIEFYDIPVEIYVEGENAVTVSNGIYSVQNERWIKEPIATDIPDYDKNLVKEGVDKFKKEYKILTKTKIEKLEPEDIDALINKVYAERKAGIAISEYNERNLVFKEVRNAGYLDKLKELKNEVISYKLSLQEDLFEVLSNKEYYDFKNEMSKIAHNQVILHDRGNFEIHLVKQKEVDQIIKNLNKLPYMLSVEKYEGRFDFSKPPMIPGQLPEKYFTIIGKINIK